MIFLVDCSIWGCCDNCRKYCYNAKQTDYNACNAIYSEEDLVNAALWYSTKPICRHKKVSMHGGYPCVSLYETKIHIHRLLMMYWLNSEIPDGLQVHHIDGNKLNASKENLTLLPSGVHQSHHNSGKTLSTEHRQKISDRNRERRGIRHKPKKPDITPENIYKWFWLRTRKRQTRPLTTTLFLVLRTLPTPSALF